MKISMSFPIAMIAALLICAVQSCEKEAEEFLNSEPVSYYMTEGESLIPTPTAGTEYTYITNYIYPTSTTMCEWSRILDHHITKGEYGYDLLFWSAEETKARIEFILKEDGQEQVLASKELTIPFYGETTGVDHNNDINNNPLEGINPKSGKNGELIFRITHIEGTERIEVLYAGKIGYIGCTSITVYEDR